MALYISGPAERRVKFPSRALALPGPYEGFAARLVRCIRRVWSAAMPAAVRVRAYLKRGKGVPPATGELRVDASSAVEWTAADGDERPRSVPADDVVRVLTKGEKPMIKVRRACVMCRRLWRKSNRRGFCCARVQHRRGSTSGQATGHRCGSLVHISGVLFCV